MGSQLENHSREVTFVVRCSTLPWHWLWTSQVQVPGWKDDSNGFTQQNGKINTSFQDGIDTYIDENCMMLVDAVYICNYEYDICTIYDILAVEMFHYIPGRHQIAGSQGDQWDNSQLQKLEDYSD